MHRPTFTYPSHDVKTNWICVTFSQKMRGSQMANHIKIREILFRTGGVDVIDISVVSFWWKWLLELIT